MKNAIRFIAAALIAAAAAPAHAYGVVYVAPSAPAYYAPQPPVYVQPVPVYVQPAPVYYSQQPAPVYYSQQPAPMYYVDPAVAGAAVAVTGIALALAIRGHHYAPVHHYWH
ncbi:hypothetical protein [Paraburkholderia sp. GAS32]|uniref:hypothetical protein n=1 Tax=Paraburkholderia sp. GAS32 TaxID=3035129 RepID=UPI003D1D007B